MFTGDYFLEEIRGLADASGVDYKVLYTLLLLLWFCGSQSVLQKIQRIHMIGELTKGSCSMFGANGSATPDGSLLQLRALDWNVDGNSANVK